MSELRESGEQTDSELYPFGKPLDPKLLEEPVPEPPRAFPTAVVMAIAVPLAALAASAGLQRLIEGPLPEGDAAGRWQLWGALIGAVLGLVAGLFLAKGAKTILWLAWGALSPLLLPALVTGVVHAVLPIREQLSDRQVAECRQTRKICSAEEFRALCTRAATSAQAKSLAETALGDPMQSLCDAAGCTHRWLYAGPWTPNNWIAPGSILCSVVVDAQGHGLRSAVGPGPERP